MMKSIKELYEKKDKLKKELDEAIEQIKKEESKTVEDRLNEAMEEIERLRGEMEIIKYKWPIVEPHPRDPLFGDYYWTITEDETTTTAVMLDRDKIERPDSTKTITIKPKEG